MEISVVVPVFREERSIRPFLNRLVPAMQSLGVNYEVIFCLDPCDDSTEDVIAQEIRKNSSLKMVVFSRRFGQPAAVMAGLFFSTGRTCVVIDVDLQDPPELIVDLYRRILLGSDVVYAKRRSRQGETVVKRLVSSLGYFVINRLSEVDIPRDTGDFRIMTRRVVTQLLELRETHGFLRGMVAFVGFRQDFIYYDRAAREDGQGKYNRFTGSIRIGLNGLIGFSSKPLFLMSICGFCLAGLSFLLGVSYFLQRLMGVDLTPGLPTTVIVVSFFAGLQLLGLGLIGEYVGRIYDEVKRRPSFIVDRKFNI